MTETKTDVLLEELEQFKEEKQKIRNMVGQVGGAKDSKTDFIINFIFIFCLAVLFSMDLFRHLFHLPIPLPAIFSVEIGLLLVSIKIIWMIHRQTKVEHFQFWILNSIEYRLNEVTKDIRQMKDLLKR